MSTMSRNFDILKNKTNSQNMSSAKNNQDMENAKKGAEQSRLNIIGEGRRLHNELMSDSGADRMKAIIEICRMIYGSSGG